MPGSPGDKPTVSVPALSSPRGGLGVGAEPGSVSAAWPRHPSSILALLREEGVLRDGSFGGSFDGCLPSLPERSRVHMARSRAADRCEGAPVKIRPVPVWRLDESLWRSGSASCVAYEDPSLPGTPYVGGGGAPALDGAVCLSRITPEPRSLTAVTRDPSRAYLAGAALARLVVDSSHAVRFHVSALGVVEGARGLALQRGGCCSAPVRDVRFG